MKRMMQTVNKKAGGLIPAVDVPLTVHQRDVQKRAYIYLRGEEVKVSGGSRG